MKKKRVPKGYTHNDNKEIFRNGEHVGTYSEEDGGKLTHPESVGLRFASPISNYVRAQGWVLPTPTGNRINEVQPDPEPETETVNSGETEVVEAQEPPQEEAVVEEKVAEEIPPCPKSQPEFGSKTPAIVEWYQKYHPEEFISKYAGRLTHLGVVQHDGTFKQSNKGRRKPIL